ncbi:MAG: histidine kinase [Bacteroidales bacterium]|nr:histidine kinase [Bacteroidales bacterium]
MKKSDQAPEMIIKLSGILDYLLYECDVEKVPLQKEIDLINNYISLEKIRYDERLEITFGQKGEIDNRIQGLCAGGF